MPPKFQSSFIPKGPVSISAGVPSAARRVGEKSLLSALAFFIFTVSILLAIGVFGYRFYLEYRIKQMGVALEQARTALNPEAIRELTNLNSRIIAAEALVGAHRLITPLFAFLESSTPASVRFTSFDYSATEEGLTLILNGEAKGYAALALQAQIFNSSRYLRNQIFSDLTLNDRGGVEFSFKALVNPELLVYTAAPAVETEVGTESEPAPSAESNIP